MSVSFPTGPRFNYWKVDVLSLVFPGDMTFGLLAIPLYVRSRVGLQSLELLGGYPRPVLQLIQGMLAFPAIILLA